MQAQDDLFDGAISYSDELPLEWQAGAAADEAQRLRDAESNLRLLNTIGQLEDRLVLTDDPEPVELEVARLHTKMDALIAIVGALLPRFMPLPPPRTVHFSWRGIAWRQDDALPAAGESGSVVVYAHPALVKPLRLPARILRVADGWIRADFVELTDGCQEALERQVFLRHRRAVAGRRNLTQKP